VQPSKKGSEGFASLRSPSGYIISEILLEKVREDLLPSSNFKATLLKLCGARDLRPMLYNVVLQAQSMLMKTTSIVMENAYLYHTI
jgi:hypothetical protein